MKNGIWKPKDSSLLNHCLEYTASLQEKGRFQLCIWPEHCLIGTPGHAVVTPINSALQTWCERNVNTVQYIMKGTSCYVEMYSAIQAEVEYKSDPSTSKDPFLIEKLNESDRLIICGQALSHCVNYTTRDILDNWTKETNKIYVLSDCCSPVTSFEAEGVKFIDDMNRAGITITSSTDMTEKGIENI